MSLNVKNYYTIPTAMASAYSPDQTKAFLDYIGLPEPRQKQNTPSLALLTDLHTHTLSTVPYENLSFHYSKHHKNSLDPQEIFRKIVLGRRGRGGYCMEISILYNHILRSLGFTVYTAGVKIRRRENGLPSGAYVGWVHIVNIVTLSDGTKWMVDVAFGGDGATKPMPLVENNVLQNLGTQEIRLVKDHIPAQVDRRPETRMWVYQYRNSAVQDWNSFYAFYEVEFTEADYKVMNWFTGHSPDSPQTWGLLVIKFLRRPKEGSDGSYEVFGKRMLVDGVVKENLGGKTQVVEMCTTEGDRIAVLRRWFDIELTEEERRGIVGWKTEMRPSS
jgi:arylamine N-acetyltransferase